MIIGEPIPTTGLTVRDMDKLAVQVREVIAKMYYSHWRVVVPSPET